MCGRLDLSPSVTIENWLNRMGLSHYPHTSNAAPTESVPVVVNEGRLEFRLMKWWLTPRWVAEPSTKFSMFNARAESLHTSNAFLEPFRQHRCVIPVAGFYEWVNEGGRKYPFRIATDGSPMLLGGIWDRWQRNGQTLESFAIITTAAVPELRWLHDRQPLMIPESQVDDWLSQQTPITRLDDFLTPFLPYPLIATPVSSAVGNARFKGDIPAIGESERITPSAPL